MNVRHDLALVGWLASLAPEAAQLPGAGPLAHAALLSLYPDAAAFDGGLANCLRRCVATVASQSVEPREGAVLHRRVMGKKRLFFEMLDGEEPLLVALARGIDRIEGLQGRGVRLAPLVLDALRYQARELYPREEHGGAAAAIGVLERLLPSVPAGRRLLIDAELASLHGRAGAYARAAELRGAHDGFTALDAADAAAGGGDMDVAVVHLGLAQQIFERAGSLAGMAAVKRRRAALVEPEERVPLLRDAVSLSRRAPDDVRGVVEGLEDLSRAYAEAGRPGPAVAVLGEVAALARGAADAPGEARALQLAGRLLCESSAEHQDPGPGLVMLLFAADIGGTVDPHLADLTNRYVQGFQYTLSDSEWARIEPLFEQNRAAVVDATFARYRHEHQAEIA